MGGVGGTSEDGFVEWAVHWTAHDAKLTLRIRLWR